MNARHLRWLLPLLWFALALTAAPGAGLAQTDRARVVELIGAANDSHAAGEFSDAVRKYRQVYEITEDPRVLYRIGLAYEELANYQRAREHLELYLLAEPQSGTADRVRKKIEHLEELEATRQSSILVESIPPGADVWIDAPDGRPVGVTPVRLPVGPGTHRLLIRKTGFADVADSVDVEVGAAIERSYELDRNDEPLVAEPEPAAEKPSTDEPTFVERPVSKPEPFTGTPTRVTIGPSMTVSVLSWLCIGVGWGLVAFGATDAATGYLLTPSGPGLSNAGFVIGAGLLGFGAYFLWFKDYTTELPEAPSARLGGVDSSRVFGVGIEF